MANFIHPTAIISDNVILGDNKGASGMGKVSTYIPHRKKLRCEF